jgi:CHAD domain-containing protein
MSFSLKPGKPIRRELKRVVRHQLQRAQTHLEQSAGDDVHAARKGVKKARAVVQLLRQADTAGMRKDRLRLRDAGRTLSDLRDADALVATLDRIGQQRPNGVSEHSLATIRRELARAKARIVEDASSDGRVARAAHVLRAVRCSAADWKIPVLDARDLPDLVKTTYRASRKAMRRAEKRSRASDLHRWRKRVKALWYQLRLVEECAPGLRDTIQQLDQLETSLGEHHDLAMLQSVIANDESLRRGAADALSELSEVSTMLQNSLRRKAFDLGRRLLAAKPKMFAQTMRDALSVLAAASNAHESSSTAA